MSTIASGLRLLRGAITPALEPVWGEAEMLALEGRVGGEPTRELERELSDRTRRIPVLMENGRSALRLAIESLAPPDRPEIILPSYGCLGMATPILAANRVPVFADVDRDFGLSLESVRALASPQTGAIVLPSLYGLAPRDTRAIDAFARERGILLIDDAAQAYGLWEEGVSGELRGDVAILSCGPGKPLFGSAGGVILVRESAVATQLTDRRAPPMEDRSGARETLKRYRSRRAHARAVLVGAASARLNPNTPDASEEPSVRGMHPEDAAVMLAQIGRARDSTRSRRENVARWSKRLGQDARVATSDASVAAKCAVVLANELEREAFAASLWAEGVEVEGTYAPLHERAPFVSARRGHLSSTLELARRTLLVPANATLDDEDHARIERALARWRSLP